MYRVFFCKERVDNNDDVVDDNDVENGRLGMGELITEAKR